MTMSAVKEQNGKKLTNTLKGLETQVSVELRDQESEDEEEFEISGVTYTVSSLEKLKGKELKEM